MRTVGPTLRKSLAIASVLAPLAGASWGTDLEPRTLEEEFFLWDGTGETSAGFAANVQVGELAQYYDPDPGTTGFLTRVVVCLTGPAPGAEVKGAAVAYDPDGPGGAPGTLRAQSAETTIPAAPAPGFHCSDIAIPATEVTGPGYIGFRWSTATYPGFTIPVDTSPSSDLEPTYRRARIGGVTGSWTPLSDTIPSARALGIGLRGILEENLRLPCFDDTRTLCLADGRFRVEVDWRKRNDDEGFGHVVPYRSADSGLFYFFAPDNWEMLVKIVNACAPPFNRFWVFYSATTDVEFTLLVTDTEAAIVKTYFNPQRMAALPVQDTSAFATCP
jgi:hypothetical protein